MGSENILLNLKYIGESKIIAVNSTSSFHELESQVLSRWADLIESSISFRYSIGGISNCSIDNNLDLRNLISLCELTSAYVVGVDISKIATKPADVGVDNRNENVHVNMNSKFPETVIDSDSHIDMNNEWCLNSDCDELDSKGESDHDMHANINKGGGLNCDGDEFMPDVDFDECDGVEFRRKGVFISGFPSKSNRIPFRSVKKKVSSGNQSVFEGLGSMPSYDVCPNLKKKPLLSDSWSQNFDGGVGTIFSEGAIEFRHSLIKYSEHMGFRFNYTKNNKSYINAVCSEWDDCACQWHIKAKLDPVTNAFVVSKLNLDHTCIGNMWGKKNRRMGAKITGNLMVQDVRAKPQTRGKDIMNSLRISYGIHVPYWKARRTYEAAMNEIFGSYDESYDQLRWYCDAIGRTNPGSVVSLESDPKTHRFQRVFIAFKACLDGFKKCRPMLFIDGTFMTGRAKGTLLAATGKDGNNGLFPVAIAIVSAENKDNWIWFLEKLRDFVLHELQICYISDRNTGLMAAFPLVFEKPIHFFCLFHLLNNLRGRFTKGWTNVQRENLGVHFKNCAYAPNMRIFNEKLAIFKEVGGTVAEEWIDELPKEKWAVAYSRHIKRYGEMTSNAAEQFNAWIKEARSLPITHMIDHIRAEISTWIVDRRQDSSKWKGALCPRKEKSWNFLTDLSRSWMVAQCPSGKFEVTSQYYNVEVDLKEKTCSCYKWQIRGFPCAHAAVVICRKCPSVYNIVEECFLTKNYRSCYSYDIHSIPESEKHEFQPTDESQSKILPPFLNKPPGRPKEKRKPSFGEFPRKKHMAICTRCGSVANHDPTTCILQPGEEFWL